MKEKVFIIAEIGINHNGDLKNAKKIIDIAIDCGADAVKFQKRTPEICVSEEQSRKMRETPWGKITYLEYRNKVEFGEKEYDEIDKYCYAKGVAWFASAWDIPSLLFLRKYNLLYNKVASAMLTNHPLLHEISKEKKYTFISTGMSTIQEISEAVEIFKNNDCPFELLHCNSSYPTPPEYANLKMIEVLRNRFNCPVGYSGHEKGIQISLASVALGAETIERHITNDRYAFGTDQFASLAKSGFEKLVRDIRIIEKAMGNGIKVINEEEKKVRDKLVYFKK